jgi:hypothetical protein
MRMKHKNDGCFPQEGTEIINAKTSDQDLPSLISLTCNMNSSHFLWVRVERMGEEELIR